MKRSGVSGAARLSGVGLLVFLAMTSVAAQEAGEAVDADRGATPDGELSVEGAGHSSRPGGKGPGLDALLHLPTGFVTTEPDAVAGAGEGEWRRRFTKADRELLEARASLEDTKRELEGVADSGGGSQWSIAPPGSDSSPTTSPLSFKLREKLREGRDQIEVREKAMRGLRIEADLAGVPQSWRVAISNPTEAPRN